MNCYALGPLQHVENMNMLSLMPKPTPKESHLSTRFKILSANLTHAELARKMNVSRPTVTRLLAGTQGWTEETIRSAAKALGVSYADFWGDVKEPRPTGDDLYTYRVTVPKEWRRDWEQLLAEELRQKDPEGFVLTLIRDRLQARRK